MNKNRVLRIAVQCIKKQMQRIAFDANVARTDTNAAPYQQQALKMYTDYQEAIRVLESMMKGDRS